MEMANVDAMQRRNEWEIAGSIGVHVSIPTFVGVHVSLPVGVHVFLWVSTFLFHVFIVGVHVFFFFFYSTFLRGTDQKDRPKGMPTAELVTFPGVTSSSLQLEKQIWTIL